MIIIPSIDLKQGQCVRLKQGDFNQTVTYTNTPQKVAEQFKREGATVLHVVDLDGAKNGALAQVDLIADIVSIFSGTVQVGGGIRTTQDIDTLLSVGVKRVVIGTQALLNIPQTLTWLETYGPETIMLALDFRLQQGIPYLAADGWQTQTAQSLWDVLSLFSSVTQVLCTDISKDGMQQGPNLAVYQECLLKFPALKLQASGGISRLQDITQLNNSGLAGCIIGKAFYENTLSLPEVLQCLNNE